MIWLSDITYILYITLQRPPISTLFPYTTLFRSSFLPSEYCLTAQTVLPWIFVVFLFLLSRSLPLIDIFAPDNCHISSGGWRQSSYHPRLTISLRTPVVLPPTLAINDWRGNVSRKVEASSLGTQKPESATQRGSRQRCICVGTRRRLARSKSLLRSKASAAAPSTPP